LRERLKPQSLEGPHARLISILPLSAGSRAARGVQNQEEQYD